MEYKNSGGQLSDDRKKITFTDKKNIGLLNERMVIMSNSVLALIFGNMLNP